MKPGFLQLRCPAKVNLALSVGTPPQGVPRHPLASWMVAVSRPGDELTLRPIGGGESTFDLAFAGDAPAPHPITWPVKQDLIWRAHQLMEREGEQHLPVGVELRKRIPAGAGLGGGSSDGAGMMVGLNRMFDLGVSPARLRELGEELGSDVPFLVSAQLGEPSALVTEGGGRVEPTSNHPWQPLVLIFPPLQCPTGQVYQAFDTMSGGGGPDEQRVRDLMRQPSLRAEGLFNDLAGPACGVEPALGETRQRLNQALDRRVHVSGSGAAMFVLADSEAEATEMVHRVRRITSLPAVATRVGAA